jgi:hypothetical protein
MSGSWYHNDRSVNYNVFINSGWSSSGVTLPLSHKWICFGEDATMRNLLKKAVYSGHKPENDGLLNCKL